MSVHKRNGFAAVDSAPCKWVFNKYNPAWFDQIRKDYLRSIGKRNNCYLSVVFGVFVGESVVIFVHEEAWKSFKGEFA